MRKIENNPVEYKSRTKLVLKEVELPKLDTVKIHARARFIRSAAFNERGYIKVK